MKYEDLQGEFKDFYDKGSWESWRLGIIAGVLLAVSVASLVVISVLCALILLAE